MILVICLIVGYFLSALLCYVGNKKMLKHERWEPDWFLVLVVFIPFVNTIWGVLNMLEYTKRTSKVPNKFYGENKQD